MADKQIILVQFHDFEQKLADLTFSIVNSNKNENFFSVKVVGITTFQVYSTNFQQIELVIFIRNIPLRSCF